MPIEDICNRNHVHVHIRFSSLITAHLAEDSRGYLALSLEEQMIQHTLVYLRIPTKLYRCISVLLFFLSSSSFSTSSSLPCDA